MQIFPSLLCTCVCKYVNKQRAKRTNEPPDEARNTKTRARLRIVHAQTDCDDEKDDEEKNAISTMNARNDNARTINSAMREAHKSMHEKTCRPIFRLETRAR